MGEFTCTAPGCGREIKGRARTDGAGNLVCVRHAPRCSAVARHIRDEEAVQFGVGTALQWMQKRRGGALFGHEVPVHVVAQVGSRVTVRDDATGRTFYVQTDALRVASSSPARPFRAGSPYSGMGRGGA